jgi:hypothetical protein
MSPRTNFPHTFTFNTEYSQSHSQIASLFRCAIVNNSAGLLEAEFTKIGRIELYFCSMDSVNIVFIVVKKIYVLGNGRLDVIAQVLAECAGMSDFLFRF